jgi:hypothetical protein
MLEQVRSKIGLLGSIIVVSTLSVPAGATETLPASVRACAALTDSLQRLVCYDREVARFPEPAAKTATKPEAAIAAAKAAPTAPAAASTTPLASAPTGGAGASSAATNTGAAVGNDNAAAPPAASAKDSGRISARVVTIDHHPNEMVLHLDNGQVWQEVQSVSGDLSLREGDTVKIEKHLGSYWLSGPHVSSMKVRQIS